MVLETAKEQICINNLIEMRKDVFQVENDLIVNDIKPDVLNIINTNGVLCVHKRELLDGKIRVEGEINTYIIYLADDENGSIRTLNTCLNFAEVLEVQDFNEKMMANIRVKIKDLESRIINGRKINVKATIEVQSNICGNDNVEVIQDVDKIENMQVLKTKEQIISLLGKGNTKVNVKDNISIDETDDVAEIMKVEFKVRDKELKTSYNKILVKAEAEVAVMYLTEDNRTKQINTRIPIMGFIDIPNINENCISDVNECLNNIIIKPNNTDEHYIYIEAEVEFQIDVYETKEIDMIEDLYSISANADFSKKSMNTIIGKTNLKEENKIRENIEIPEQEGGEILTTTIRPNIINEDIRANRIIYEGEVEVELILKKGERMETTRIAIPFNFEVSSNKINTNAKISTEINIKNENFIVLQNGTLDVSMILEFVLTIEESKNLSLIEDITINDDIEDNPYSMTIYFIKPGDTLWKIAKKFKSTVGDIVRVNEIENENKINVGQQIYIPKFVKCNG